MTPQELAVLDVEVKLLDIHWTEILRILINMPEPERFRKRDQLEWLIKKGQPVLRELVLQHKVDQEHINEVISLMDNCSKHLAESREELQRLRLLARESQQFFEALTESVSVEWRSMELRNSYAKDFERMQQALAIAGYEPVAIGE